MTQSLKEYLEENKAKTEAWVAEDPEKRFASSYTTDLEHWAGYDIHTVEQFQAWEMRTQLWDLYKDIHGIRPRWMNIDEMSDAEIKHETDLLFAEWDNQKEEEKEEKRVESMTWQEHLAEANLVRVEVTSPFAVLKEMVA